jgi:predicted transposase YbfD/YdcC
LRLIIRGIDPTALETAFRQHASSISAPPETKGLVAVAVDGQTLRGSFDAFADRKAAHMMSALRRADQIVLGHLMVEEKRNEIPAAPELIEALGLKGCVFTVDAEHAQKNVRAGDRLGQSSADPSQGQSTEPTPQLLLGTAGRKPIGSDMTKTEGRNRWETWELKVFPAKAWFRGTPWEKLIETVLRLESTVCKRDPATGLCKQTTEVVFWISSASNQTPKQWNAWIRAHWRIEIGSHYVRDTTFAEDPSRIRKNPDIAARLRSFAYNLIRASEASNIRKARWQAALDLSRVLQMPRLC